MAFNYLHRDAISNDILDLLPSDPFGMVRMDMDMDISSIYTAIVGSLEYLEVDYDAYEMVEDVGESYGDDESFPELNFIWNSINFEAFLGNDITSAFDCIDGSSADPQVEDVPCLLEDDGAPHAALSFALRYLGLRDLLAVESTCRSLCSTVQDDTLLWMSIHIDQPLNERITDDILLKICSRAQGKMQSLTLVRCPGITDDCLKQVLDCNSSLTKLSVPDCTRLSIEAIVTSVKAFNSTGNQAIRHLRIGGLYGLTRDHLEELLLLLGNNSLMQHNAHMPHFFNMSNQYLLCNDARSIDVETCPICQNVKLIYDCPAETCEGKKPGNEVCRACTLCIPRCFQCGRCIKDDEYEETFCLQLRCLKCKQEREVGPSQCAIFHESNCPFCVRG